MIEDTDDDDPILMLHYAIDFVMPQALTPFILTIDISIKSTKAVLKYPHSAGTLYIVTTAANASSPSYPLLFLITDV